MTRRTKLLTATLSLVLLCSITVPVLANPLPLEPADDHLINEEVDYVVGFYFREYSVADNGVVDYRTARQILTAEPGEYHTMVIEAKEFPLFYWYDGDQDGEFDVWIDRNVQGCVCDIVQYDKRASRP